jgi:RNA polymerase sigma-70 factor (ECF subfamily)
MLGPTEAEDVVQRVFLESLSALRHFRGDARLGTWLHGIAINVVRLELRARGRRDRKHGALADDGARDGDPGEGGARPDRQAEARERLAIVQAAVEALDFRLRTVWVLREIEGASVEEAAAALGVPAATVRTRHHRARARVLAALLAADGFRAPETRGARVLRRLRAPFLGRQEAGS